MSQKKWNLAETIKSYEEEELDLSKYESSFKRWLVSEIESGRLTVHQARDRYDLPRHFSTIYRDWQLRYSESFYISLKEMTKEERLAFEKQEARIKELESKLEYAQKQNIALNTVIDIAEKDFKLVIRKKSGSKQ